MWNFEDINFLAFFSNFATFFFLSQFFYSSAIFLLYYSLLLFLPLLLFSLLSSFFSLSFYFCYYSFPTLASTISYTCLDISSSSLLLSSSQSQNCSELAIVFSKLYSTTDYINLYSFTVFLFTFTICLIDPFLLKELSTFLT